MTGRLIQLTETLFEMGVESIEIAVPRRDKDGKPEVYRATLRAKGRMYQSMLKLADAALARAIGEYTSGTGVVDARAAKPIPDDLEDLI